MQLKSPPDVATVAPPMGALRYIRLGGEIVNYRFHRARRRSIGLAIDDSGLRVAAPGDTPIAEVEAFILKKSSWVLRRLSAWRAMPKPQVVNWSDGTLIALLGASIRIELLPGRHEIALYEGRLGIGLAPGGGPADLRRRGIAWFKDRARRLFRERLALYAAKLGVPTPELTLSNARRQWGVCRKDGHVRLNWRLIHLPLHLVDYVAAHELAHLREMNHSPRFWAVVNGLYPDYKAARKQLRESNHRLPIL